MAKREPTPAHLKWLRANKHNLAPLTGQDYRALAAIAACWELLCSDTNGRRGAIDAVIALLPAMQSKCWPLARELIAMVLDWDDRERVWSEIEEIVGDRAALESGELGERYSRLAESLLEMRSGGPRPYVHPDQLNSDRTDRDDLGHSQD